MYTECLIYCLIDVSQNIVKKKYTYTYVYQFKVAQFFLPFTNIMLLDEDWKREHQRELRDGAEFHKRDIKYSRLIYICPMYTLTFYYECKQYDLYT